MAVIRTACPACRATVAVGADQLLLAPRPQPPATYTLCCTACGTISVKRADSAAEGLIRAAGAVPVPAGTRHPELPPDGPPLTYDDLLDLHLLLASPRWLEHSLGVPRRWADDGRERNARRP